MIRLLRGDALTVLRSLEPESVHCCVTSPPYFGLRRYIADDAPEKQFEIGLEQTPDEFIRKLVEVFAEVRRVLRPDGTLWLNVGDSYAGSGKGPSGGQIVQHAAGVQTDKHDVGGWRGGTVAAVVTQNGGALRVPGFKPKDLLLIPFRLAIALQADGWYVRSDIAWCKKSCMPESVQDRPTSAWEHVFLLSKQRTYYYDADAVREDCASEDDPRNRPDYEPKRGAWVGGGINDGRTRTTGPSTWPSGGRNMRNFWLLGPEPYAEAHFATFVPEIPRRAILAGTSERGVCPECGAPWVRVVETTRSGAVWINPKAAITQNGGKGTERLGPGIHDSTTTTGWRASCAHPGEPIPATVLDCFSGAGTSGLVADRLGRNAVLVELNPAYADMAERRIAGESPMFAEIVA